MEIVIAKAILLLGKVCMTTILVLTIIDSYESDRMVKEYLENMEADTISQQSTDMRGEVNDDT